MPLSCPPDGDTVRVHVSVVVPPDEGRLVGDADSDMLYEYGIPATVTLT
ncbi:MAG: hypothetical protein QW658_02725 [Candidatus Bathyarchaeia archaeon]